MENIGQIASPYTASWVMWLVFGLTTATIVLSRLRLETVVADWKGLFSHSERSYSNYSPSILSRLSILLLQVVLMSLIVLLWCFDGGNFTMQNFGKTLVVVVSVLVVTACVMEWVQWICLSPMQHQVLREQYASITHCVILMMWLVVLVLLHVPMHSVVNGAIIGILSMESVLMLIKYIQLFNANMLGVLYALIYIVCLQWLPVGGMLLLTKQVL